MTAPDKHHNDHHGHGEHAPASGPIRNTFMENWMKLINIFDAPATFFHGNTNIRLLLISFSKNIKIF